MKIRTFIGTSTGDLQVAVEQAEKQANDYMGSVYSYEIVSVRSQSLSDQNGYTHIITLLCTS